VFRSLNRRFNRIESNVVTLARNIDHIRSEIRSQAETSQQLDELRVDVNEFKDSFYSGNNSRQQIPQRSRDYDQRLHRLQKLKRYIAGVLAILLSTYFVPSLLTIFSISGF
jgi:septal ring factor EnvC (AmiA/AmiB activator)